MDGMSPNLPNLLCIKPNGAFHREVFAHRNQNKKGSLARSLMANQVDCSPTAQLFPNCEPPHYEHLKEKFCLNPPIENRTLVGPHYSIPKKTH